MNLVKIAIYLGLGILLLTTIVSVVNLSNSEVKLRNKFVAEFTKRTAFYDNLWKTIAQTNSIAKRNDTSYMRNISIIMAARTDQQSNLMFKFVQETNPNSNFAEVSRLNERVMNIIESKRDELFELETRLADIQMQHKNKLRLFPGGWILRTFFGIEEIEFKPITSDRTDNVIKTGKDNDISL